MTFQAHSEALLVLQDIQALHVCLETFWDILVAFQAHPEISLASLEVHLDPLDLLDLLETFWIFCPLLWVALQDNQGLLECLPNLLETPMHTLHGHMLNLQLFRCSGIHIQPIPSLSLEETLLV